VLITVGAALAVMFVLGLWEYATVDHIGILDSVDVGDRAAQACAALEEQFTSIPPPTPGDAAGAMAMIRAQDHALTGLVTSMESLGQDRLNQDNPAQQWLADWRTLIGLREVYADGLAAGLHPALEIPTVDGYPITHRMTELSVGCPSPVELTTMPA
jgi:hypothetical protein